MKLPVMPYQWRVFVHGLIASMFNGIGNSIVVVMVDPVQFNLFQGGFTKLATVACASAIFAFFTYLKDHPLPDPMKDTDYRQAVTQQIVELKSTGDGSVNPPKV